MYRLSLFVFLLFTFSNIDAVSPKNIFEIVRLNTPTINIGGKDLAIGKTFAEGAEIKWSGKKQHMEAKNKATGELYQFSENVMASRGLKSLKDYFLYTSKASTRDLGDGVVTTYSESPNKSSFAEKRIALLIGNSNYASLGYLRNAQRDAEDIGGVLSELGFDVLECYEAGYDDMKSALSKFAALASKYDMALFYYAGHGLQHNGKNYLIPVDAKLEMHSELEHCLNADDVLQQMEDCGVASRVLMLDACRNTPRSWSRSSQKGLARMEGSAGSVILFSTGSGEVALDGEGDNSPFAQAVMANMVRPRVPFSRAVNDIANDTYDFTGEVQYPLLVGTLRGDFRFNSAGLAIAIASAGSSVASTPIPTQAPRPTSSASEAALPRQESPEVPAGSEVDFDSELEVAVESCKRSGSNLYIIVKITNPTNQDYRFNYTAYGSAAIDDQGNEYGIKYGKGKSRENLRRDIYTTIPRRGITYLTVLIENFESTANKVSALYFKDNIDNAIPVTIRDIPVQKGRATFLSASGR